MGLSEKHTAWYRYYLVLVYTKYSILGVKIDLILVLHSQFLGFLREMSYKHALKHVEAAGPEKNGTSFFFLL